MKQTNDPAIVTGFSIRKSLLEIIDAERGLIPRSTYVNHILHEALIGSKAVKA
jgi:hypothetical protein